MTGRGERGNALFTVMMAMVVLMGIAGALTEHMAGQESQEISESLVRVQTYWAMRGLLDRAASRVGNVGTTRDLGDAVVTSNLVGYIGESDLNPVQVNSQSVLKKTSDSGVTRHRWYYPEMGSSYLFDVETNLTSKYNPVVTNPAGQDLRSASGTQPDSSDANGRLYLLFTLANAETSAEAVTPAPVLRDIDIRFPSLKANLCVGNVAKASRTLNGGCINAGTGDAGIVTVEKLNLVYRGRP